jgi:hypothetical protein
VRPPVTRIFANTTLAGVLFGRKLVGLVCNILLFSIVRPVFLKEGNIFCGKKKKKWLPNPRAGLLALGALVLVTAP